MSDLVMTTQIGGMNDYTAPDFLQSTNYARGINITSRGGKVHTRPRFKKVSTLPEGRFQGIFSLESTLYAVIAGTVYKSDDAETWTEVEGVTLAEYVPKVWATAVNDFLFINDGINFPAVVGPYDNRNLSKQENPDYAPDGDISVDPFVRSPYLPEIPPGTVCAYGQSRIFFTDRYRRTLMASNVYKPGDPSSVLLFTEQTYLNESFSITQPAAYGRIMAMEFLRNSESGTGLGQLVVFYEGGVCAYNVGESRSNWLNIQLGQSWFKHNGMGGAACVLPVNNDLFYRNAEGLTTIRTTLSSTSQQVQTLPLSMPLLNTLKRDQIWTLEYVSTAYNDNRLLFTHGLRVDEEGDVFFDSLVAMDLASFYLSGETQMTFDGLWLGPKMTKVFTGKYRGNSATFVTAKSENNGNTLWALSDSALDDEGTAPRSRHYTRKLFFNDNAYNFAKFQMAEIWLEDMKSDCEVALYFRGDNNLWQLASEGSIKVPYYTAEPQDYAYVLPQGRAKVRIAINEDECDPVLKRNLRSATGFQFCIEVTGVATAARMRFSSQGAEADNGEILLCEADNTDILLTSNEDAFVLYDYDEGFLE